MVSTNTHLNLIQLATLREFARLGTLSAVADSLGYSPGAVSQHISALERSVGEQLVERSGRRRVLTDAGHVLARYAESIIASEREALKAVSALKGQVAGPLTVGTWGSTAALLLAPVIRRMATAYPDVHVRSKEVVLDDAASEVRRGVVDVAFGLDHDNAPLPRVRGIDIQELLEEQYAIAISASLIDGASLAADGTIDVATLAGLPWILPPTTIQVGLAIRAGFRSRGFEPLVVHEMNDTVASLQLAAAGLGATITTPLMQRLNPTLELVTLTMADPLSRRIVMLAPTEHAQRSVPAFTRVTAEVVASLLGLGEWS